jgi:hypothetical protein
LDFFQKKTEVPVFPEKNSGNPRKTRKNASDQSKAVKHTPRCLNISRKHKIKPKNSFQWLKFDRKTNRKFARRSRDLMIKYWKFIPTM